MRMRFLFSHSSLRHMNSLREVIGRDRGLGPVSRPLVEAEAKVVPLFFPQLAFRWGLTRHKAFYGRPTGSTTWRAPCVGPFENFGQFADSPNS